MLGLAGCRDPGPRHATLDVRGQPAHLQVASGPRDQLPLAVGLAGKTLIAAHDSLDPRRAESDIAKINRVANMVRLQISYNTFRVIDLAHHYGELTGGAFDITAASLEALWGFGAKPPTEVPDDEVLEATLLGVGSDKLQVFDQGSVALTTPLTRIGLGDLLPAYAVDLAIIELRRSKVEGALLQWGRAVRALGEPAPGQTWTTDIPHPFEGELPLGRLALARPGAALVLVHLYDRSVTLDGHTYGHVIDPRTGRPVEDTVLAAVLGPTATQAHALARALVVLGVERGATILPEFPRYEVLVIPNRKPVEAWMTPGFADRFTVAAGRNITTHEIAVAPPPEAPVAPAP